MGYDERRIGPGRLEIRREIIIHHTQQFTPQRVYSIAETIAITHYKPKPIGECLTRRNNTTKHD
jgi:hypothetical protein